MLLLLMLLARMRLRIRIEDRCVAWLEVLEVYRCNWYLYVAAHMYVQVVVMVLFFES